MKGLYFDTDKHTVVPKEGIPMTGEAKFKTDKYKANWDGAKKVLEDYFNNKIDVDRNINK